ncbi:MAG: hypothetical protein PHE78_00210 [Candidatus Gastranaerophilales bacterium]|nr:hypothetical protein [Candidatus Gastranaerophilales bacterium]
MDFIKYFRDKKVQKTINKLARKYKNKKVVLYGAGEFAAVLFQNYDLSELNIVAVADLNYIVKKDFFGIPVVNPYELKDISFDLLLITSYKTYDVIDFLDDELFSGYKPEFKIKPLIKMSLWEYFKRD